tara:strand:- start:894 stop:1067 length:174 start_codon:yes stop_codon:yes gene_type:complete
MNEDVKQILEELKEYRAELVHKNYPMGRINEIIMKWESKSVKVIDNDDMDPLGEEED